MKKSIGIAVILLFLNANTCLARSQAGGAVVFKNTLYGALTGALIGGASLVFTSEPEEHLDYILYGAAIGTMVGALFGTYEALAFINFNNGDIKYALPTPRLVPERNGRGVTRTSFDVLRINF